jgi:hypothetical protein
MVEIGPLVSTVVAGYDWLRVWHERQANPPHLPLHALLVFKAFKAAYDGKDVARLACVIADDYRGNVFGVTTKAKLLEVQGHIFRWMPWGIRPCLVVNVYGILDDEPRRFRGVVDTQSRVTVFGIPTVNYDSAPLRCEIRQRDDGVWQIASMFVEWELVKR